MGKISKQEYMIRRILGCIVLIILFLTIQYWFKYAVFILAIAIPILLFIPERDDGIEYFNRENVKFPFIYRIAFLFFFIQLATYIMCIYRWYVTDHHTFWSGFKELIWALCPIVNFTYIWDIWFTVIFVYIPNFYKMIL